MNYSQIYSEIEAEIKLLQNKREAVIDIQSRLRGELAENEKKLAAINAHEEKLTQVFESVAELLSIVPDEALTETSNHLVTESDSESFFTSDQEPFLLSGQVEEVSASATDSGIVSTLIASESARAAISEIDKATIPVKEPAKNETSPKSIIAHEPHKIFDKKEFWQMFPHLKNNQQPVHVQAAKILEYYGRGRSISQITQDILTLGHKHNSSNFHDTVHTTLKKKRSTTGEFRYNRIEQVWELSHWEVTNESPDETPEANPKKGAEVTEKKKMGEPPIKEGPVLKRVTNDGIKIYNK